MGLFTLIPEAHAIVRDNKGGYFQLDLYERQTPGEDGSRIYIKKGAFHYLRVGGTSNPSLKLDELVMNNKTYRIDDMNRYCLVK